MIYLLFVVVANIANNLNNNNNNQNDNNLNYVNQQNNNLNMNQNIVNQLNIDLPPPVPGKRSVGDKRLAQAGLEKLKYFSCIKLTIWFNDLNSLLQPFYPSK